MIAMIFRSAVILGSIQHTISTTILPSDNRIRYIGRFTTDDEPAFSWANSRFTFSFQGAGKVFVNFSRPYTTNGDYDRFQVFLDGNDDAPHQDFIVNSTSFVNYLAVNAIEVGDHVAEIWKVTEDLTKNGPGGTIQFGGLSSDDVKFSAVAPPRASRRLEFIGDSDTSG